MNEWWVSVLNEGSNERVNELIVINQPVNNWLMDWLNKRAEESMNECVYERKKKMNEWIMSEWMNDLKNESVGESEVVA